MRRGLLIAIAALGLGTSVNAIIGLSGDTSPRYSAVIIVVVTMDLASLRLACAPSWPRALFFSVN